MRTGSARKPARLSWNSFTGCPAADISVPRPLPRDIAASLRFAAAKQQTRSALVVLHHLGGLLRGSARASCDTLPARVRYVSHTTSPTSAEASVGPVPCSPQRITLRRIPLVNSRSHITAPPCPHAVSASPACRHLPPKRPEPNRAPSPPRGGVRNLACGVPVAAPKSCAVPTATRVAAMPASDVPPSRPHRSVVIPATRHLRTSIPAGDTEASPAGIGCAVFSEWYALACVPCNPVFSRENPPVECRNTPRGPRRVSRSCRAAGHTCRPATEAAEPPSPPSHRSVRAAWMRLV